MFLKLAREIAGSNLQLDAVRAGSARGGQLPLWHSQL